MNLSEAAQAIHGELMGPDGQFSAVSIDSRTIKPGELFFALRGPNFDGHDFIPAAVKAGAIAAVVSKSIANQLPLIKVGEVNQALIDLAQYHREQMPCVVVAVTGSCGKTTTRSLLQSVFQQAGNTLASEKSFNNEIGVPLTLLRITKAHQYAISEMGANHPGEIAKLTHIARPNVAIITNAGAAHLEGFGNLEGVACAKGEIFQGLNKDGVAVINQDDQFAKFWKKLAGNHQIMTFSSMDKADVYAEGVILDDFSRPRFNLHYQGQKETVQLSLMGKHNVNNALAAAAAAFSQGLSMTQVKAGLELGTAVNKRLNEIIGFAGALIIDDSYNANPLSVTAAMQVLTSRRGASVLVLGDMLELGEKATQLHYDLGLTASKMGINQLFCCGELTQNTVKAFGKNGYHFESQDDLIDALKDTLNQNTNVLIKGSLAMNMSRVVDALTEK